MKKKATQFAEQAGKIVGDLTEDQVKEVNYKPVIKDTAPNEDTLVPTEVINNKLTVSESAQSRVQNSLNALTIVQDEHFTTAHISIANLFDDPDQAPLAVTTSGESTFDEAGLIATFSGSDLVLSANTAGIIKAGVFTIILQSQDKAADGSQVGSPVSTKFTLKVDSANLAPIVDKEVETQIQREIEGWQLQEGELFSQTISLTPLFTDTDGEIKSTKVGLGGVVDGLSSNTDLDNLIVTISGTPKMEWNQKGKITLQVTDDKNAESETVTFLMPEVKAGVTPPPETHPLEGKTWYMLEHGSDDGNDYDEYDYSRVWCDSIRFEDGIVYGNVRSEANRTTCGEATTQTENATYKVENGQLIATFHFEEGGIPQIESFAVEMAGDANEISQGAKTIVHRSVSSNVSEAERYTYYSSKADAEARIQVRSDDVADKRFGYIYLPAEQNNTYNLGMVSFALVENSQGYNAYLNFDVEGKDFSCATVNEFYKSFKLTGNDLATSFGQHEISGSCNTITDEEFTYASIYFNLSEIQDLAVDNIYSFIGKTVDTNGEYAEAVKFNIKWTGTGNNE